MGTVRWDLSAAKSWTDAAGEFAASGNHTSSTTASNITDGAAGAGSAVTASVGQVLNITCDELARVQIGGGTATATGSHLLQAGVARQIAITASGTVSVIDEA
jgi:hypothetical protein